MINLRCSGVFLLLAASAGALADSGLYLAAGLE